LNDRWKTGKARAVYLNGHTDSIYCLQFDEYEPLASILIFGSVLVMSDFITGTKLLPDHAIGQFASGTCTP
jgi:hypothetical protein